LGDTRGSKIPQLMKIGDEFKIDSFYLKPVLSQESIIIKTLGEKPEIGC